MTGLLKETFTEEAEAIGDPHLDLDAIVATGNRRIKRRRLASVITAVAASAAVIGGGLTAVQHFSTDQDAPAASGGPLAERRPTWADGKEIHYGSEVIRLPSAVASFLQTDAAFVYTSADGSVYRAGDGAAVRIGKGSKNHLLAADADRSVVGWVDATPVVPEFVLYDLDADREVARTSIGNKRGTAAANAALRVSAIDNGTAYFGATDGLHRWNIASATGELIKPKVLPKFLIASEAGQLLWENPVDGDIDMGIGPDVNAANPAHYNGWRGTLSPQARYVLTDKADIVGVVDVRNGQTATLTVDGYVLIVPTQWKNDHVFYATAFRDEKARLDLLTCTIKSASKTSCETTLKSFAPPLGDKSTTQFPNGLPVQ